LLPFTSIGLGEDFHLQAVEHAQHTTKPLARRTRWELWVLHARFAICSSSRWARRSWKASGQELG